MRVEALLLSLLIAVFSNPPDAVELPRGTPGFTLGMSREELNSRILQRGLHRISEAGGMVAVSTDIRDGDFEKYAFVRAPEDSQLILYQATVAFRFPADSTVFHRVAEELRASLGAPRIARGDRDLLGRMIGLHERTWTDDRVVVRLAVRFSEEPDPNTDRMQLTWTDLRLQRIARAIYAEGRRRNSR